MNRVQWHDMLAQRVNGARREANRPKLVRHHGLAGADGVIMTDSESEKQRQFGRDYKLELARNSIFIS